MSDTEVAPKRKYKKAGPNDKRRVTSKLNLQKARERKLELLRKAKEIEVEKTEPFVAESDPESESDSSDDEDVIVIAPKRKSKKKEKEKEKEKESDIRKELNELKAMLAKKTQKRQPKKKQIINILPPNPTAPAPVPEPPKDTGVDLFKKLLLSQCK